MLEYSSKHRWLFLDMNSFFASIEQQERPELRGKPMAVAPILSDATCVIAASYAAKPFGVKTGVNIGAAKRMCPNITIVEARPALYIDYHRKLIDTVKEVLPQPKTLSVDEIACRLWENEAEPAAAIRLAMHLKDRVRKVLGENMYSSVGIAPNVFLAKVSADIYKPNGLTLIHPEDVPRAFTDLVLRDLPGVGRKMHARLNAAGIHTIQQLYAASEEDLAAVWGGIVGQRWWYMLRGSTEVDYGSETESPPRTVSNSHVIEPTLRTSNGAETIALRLLGKAAGRLRNKEQMARRLHVSVSYQGDHLRRHTWKVDSGNVEASGDLLHWLPVFRSLWSTRPRLANDFVPKKVSVAFTDLIPSHDISGSLFEPDAKIDALSQVLDHVNRRYRESAGRHNMVDLASIYLLNQHAPERIAFRKISDDDREQIDDAA